MVRTDQALTLPPFPVLRPLPVVGDLIDHWPAWPVEQETRLAWTKLEQEVYHSVAYGSDSRRVDLGAPLPTALHSWGSALYGCPCQCRTTGLSPLSLQTKGLRGVEVISALWPGVSRHIHPQELQLILGFPPAQSCVDFGRADLCLLGNSVSPLQILWLASHVLVQLGVLKLCPLEVLRCYMTLLVHQRDLCWPRPLSACPSLCLRQDGHKTFVSFGVGMTVKDLLEAEWQLTGEWNRLWHDGILVPLHAALQPLCYDVVPVLVNPGLCPSVI